MKIAVLYSGLVRLPKEIVLDNIRTAKLCFPTADFYFGAWKNDKLAVELGLIDYFFDEPKFRYNPYNLMIKTNIIILKHEIAINGDSDKIKNLKDSIFAMFKKRSFAKYNNNQHLIHAMMVEKISDRDYDVIVRLRYDTEISRKLIDKSYDFLKICYEEKSPIGFAASRLNDDCGWSDNYFHDHMIIHRKDMFDYNLVYEMHKHHKLQFGEIGWVQILCDSYGGQNIKKTYNGLVRRKAFYEIV